MTPMKQDLATREAIIDKITALKDQDDVKAKLVNAVTTCAKFYFPAFPKWYANIIREASRSHFDQFINEIKEFNATEMKKDKRGFLGKIFCKRPEIRLIPTKYNPNPVNPCILKLMEVVLSRCIESENIFRREGNRKEAKDILYNTLENNNVNYGKYSIYTLGTALKNYLREDLDGLFNPVHVKIILNRLDQGKYEEAEELVKSMIFSLDELRMTVLVKLVAIIDKISANYESTQLDLDGLCNILGLTCTPFCLFNDLDMIKNAIAIFRMVCQTNLEAAPVFK